MTGVINPGASLLKCRRRRFCGGGARRPALTGASFVCRRGVRGAAPPEGVGRLGPCQKGFFRGRSRGTARGRPTEQRYPPPCAVPGPRRLSSRRQRNQPDRRSAPTASAKPTFFFFFFFPFPPSPSPSPSPSSRSPSCGTATPELGTPAEPARLRPPVSAARFARAVRGGRALWSCEGAGKRPRPPRPSRGWSGTSDAPKRASSRGWFTTAATRISDQDPLT